MKKRHEKAVVNRHLISFHSACLHPEIDADLLPATRMKALHHHYHPERDDGDDDPLKKTVLLCPNLHVKQKLMHGRSRARNRALEWVVGQNESDIWSRESVNE